MLQVLTTALTVRARTVEPDRFVTESENKTKRCNSKCSKIFNNHFNRNIQNLDSLGAVTQCTKNKYTEEIKT